jgi:peptide-methionine (S)-S-oxide reductase
MKITSLVASLLIASICHACSSTEIQARAEQPSELEGAIPKALRKVAVNDTAYFASGCFWCVEAIFEATKGVGDVVSGYCGGKKLNPTYEEVCAGTTGHAESVMVPFDSTEITYKELLIVFFGSHDPSTLNQQGNDRGTQYRSLIMAKNEQHYTIAKEAIAAEKETKKWSEVTTQLISKTVFYPAEDYHQNYERLNPEQPYVKAVSVPRLNIYKADFPQYLKQ